MRTAPHAYSYARAHAHVMHSHRHRHRLFLSLKETHTYIRTDAISCTHQLRSFGGAGADWLHFFLFQSFPRNYRPPY